MAISAFTQRSLWRYGLAAFVLAVFAVFMIWPIALTLRDAFITTEAGETRWTLDHLAGVLRDPVLRGGLINSFIIAVLTTVLCLLIAVPLAVVATHYEFRGKALFSALLLVPLILPPFVGAIGLRQILGRFGALNTALISMGLADPAAPPDWLGGDALFLGVDAKLLSVVVMQALHLYPIIYLNASAALANIDPALEQAAENLGASRWQRFRRITLPLILPGLFAGGTIVFIWAFTELGTPLMFDFYEVTPVQVFWRINEMGSDPQPYALVAVMLIASVLMYALGKWAFGGRGYAMTTRAASTAGTHRLTGLSGLAALLAFAFVTALAILPHAGVVLTSLTAPGSWYQSILPQQYTDAHYLSALTHPMASISIQNSLIYASLAMLLDIALGLLIAWLIVRGRIMGRSLLDALAMLPLAVPGLVLAFGYVAMSLEITRFFGGTDAAPNWVQVVGQNPNPMVFLIIAYAIRRLPYVVRSAVAGLEQTSGELEEAALNLGASQTYAVRRIVVPLIMANLIAGGLLAFSFAMLEVSDSLILAQTTDDYPITKAIYSLFERLGDGPYIASAMGVWGMALLTITLVGASVLLGKKLGAVFRI